MKRFSILLVVLTALLVGACSSEDPSVAPSEAPATVQPTPEPTPEPSEEPSNSGFALPSLGEGDPELAGRFPDTVGGLPLQVQSVSGDAFAALGGGADPAFEAFLESVGAEVSDVSVAFGGVNNPEDPTAVLSVGAFRVLGASEDVLEEEFIGALGEVGSGPAGFEAATVAGKDVLTADDPTGTTENQVFIYTQDDTLYFLTGTEEQVAEILEVLP